MRRVDRVRAPAFVKDEEFLQARMAYEDFRAAGGTRATQKILDVRQAFGPYVYRMADYAYDLFLGKCAYTEVPTEPELHLHRPEADAYDDVEGVSADHYWWTAAWYRNWYVASGEVAARKRNHFPLTGPRAVPPQLGPQGMVEQPGKHLDRGLILDPCQDHPQLHIRFMADGTAQPWAAADARWLRADANRGEATIELLALNSPHLIASRREAIEAAMLLIEDRDDGLSQAIDPSLPHAGAVRQVLAGRLTARGPRSLTPQERALAPELVPHLAAAPGEFPASILDAVRASLRRGEGPLRRLLESAVDGHSQSIRSARTVPRPAPDDRGSEGGSRAVIPRTATITRVFISNFQAIEEFDFSFPATAGEVPEGGLGGRSSDRHRDLRRPWWVLLGENGTGKSSVLKAIGLALATESLEDLVVQGNLRWGDLLRRGASEGRVLVEFTGGVSIDLRFDPGGARFVGGAPSMATFVRGFGATRLLEDASPGMRAHVRLGNLYQPRVPVIDAERWLVEVPDEEDFNAVAVTIARLLDREQDVTDRGGVTTPKFIQRVGNTVEVGGHPLRNLSDGYRSVIAMACDLMAGAGTGFSDMKNANGIVLLDELGSHLHPRWKMKITGTLREVFPAMQFLVTTHDPLCLRGLVANEVIAVRASSSEAGVPWHSVFDRLEQSPSRLRVDQLLTSEFFGLDTSIDPEVDEQFQRYYAMLRRDDPADRVERQSMRSQLSQHGVLGYTARDQLVYDAIDEYLARRPSMDQDTRREQRRQTLERVAEIWGAVAARHERGAGR